MVIFSRSDLLPEPTDSLIWKQSTRFVEEDAKSTLLLVSNLERIILKPTLMHEFSYKRTFSLAFDFM
jgi:hypothetical protein